MSMKINLTYAGRKEGDWEIAPTRKVFAQTSSRAITCRCVVVLVNYERSVAMLIALIN